MAQLENKCNQKINKKIAIQNDELKSIYLQCFILTLILSNDTTKPTAERLDLLLCLTKPVQRADVVAMQLQKYNSQ